MADCMSETPIGYDQGLCTWYGRGVIRANLQIFIGLCIFWQMMVIAKYPRLNPSSWPYFLPLVWLYEVIGTNRGH